MSSQQTGLAFFCVWLVGLCLFFTGGCRSDKHNTLDERNGPLWISIISVFWPMMVASYLLYLFCELVTWIYKRISGVRDA